MEVVQTGVVFISCDGRYLHAGQIAGHGGPRIDYTLVEELRHATVFTDYDLRHNKRAELVALFDGGLQTLPAYVTRVVRFGVPEKTT